MAYIYFNPGQHSRTSLIAALLGPNSQLSVVEGSIILRYGLTEAGTSLSFYDGTPALGIGSGLLLTSGDGAPPQMNSFDGYTEEFQASYVLNAAGLAEIPAGSTNQDQDLRAAVDQAFVGAGDLNDITYLEFTINVTNPAVRGIRFDVVFGSEEYPEWSDEYVDIAGVFVNGVNYALFNRSATQPLSVLQQNLAAGNFRDNQAGTLPIEYDGLSSRLQIIAPVHQGLNTFKVAVGDTGDSMLDSGIFISSLVGVDYTGFGLAQAVSVPQGLSAPFQDYAGNQIYDLGPGNISIAINGGDDVVNGGAGLNKVFLHYSVGSLLGYALDQGSVTVVGPSGQTQMVEIERVQFSDLLVALDTEKGGNTWNAFSLLHAGFGFAPPTEILSQWTAEMDRSSSLTELAQKMLDFYAPQGVADSTLISLLFQNLAGITPDAGQIAAFEAMIGPGRTFAGQADLLAYASQLDLGGAVTQLIGVVQVLDSYYLEPDPWIG